MPSYRRGRQFVSRLYLDQRSPVLESAPPEALPAGDSYFPDYIRRPAPLLNVSTPQNLTLSLPVEVPFFGIIDKQPNRGLLGRILFEFPNLLANTLAAEAPFFSRLEVLRFPRLRAVVFDPPNLLTSTLTPVPFVLPLDLPQRRPVRLLVFDAPNLLTSTLAPVAAAPFIPTVDTYRRPLARAVVFDYANLLTGTLAPVVMPVSSPRWGLGVVRR